MFFTFAILFIGTKFVTRWALAFGTAGQIDAMMRASEIR